MFIISTYNHIGIRKLRSCSSGDRMSVYGTEGHGFESHLDRVPVAKWSNASDLRSEDHGFKSRQEHIFIS